MRVSPWLFGAGVEKQTWLWSRNLPALEPTDIVTGREPVSTLLWFDYKGEELRERRAFTDPGMAEAVADQMGARPLPRVS